jgi:hypothetical protein
VVRSACLPPRENLRASSIRSSGEKFRPERVAARAGWSAIPAVRDGQLHEVRSPFILQPVPSALFDGLDALHRIITAWAKLRQQR